MRFHSKLPETTESIFTVMSKLAHESGALNLSQGFPEFRVSSELIDLAYTAMKNGLNQYAPMAGWTPLREEISLFQHELFSTTYCPEHEITITAGATQGIYTAISTLVKPGDEVITFAPAYDCYEPAVVLNGGKVISISLDGTSFHIPWEKVRSQINSKTKIIILNSPHNPSGRILTPEDIYELQQIISHNDIYIISDEVYAHIVFDQKKHLSLASFEDLKKRSYIVHSFGKTFHATGWKIGYVLAPKKLTSEFRKVHSNLVFSVNTPVQAALAEYMRNRDHIYSIGKMYEQKRNSFLNALENSKFKFRPTQGSYFQLLDYSEISDHLDVELAKKWTKKYGIASIPISVFYPDNRNLKLLRFCFAKTEETLEKASQILCRI